MKKENFTENKWYDNFNKKKSPKISAEKNERKEFNRERDKFFDEKRRGLDKKRKIQQIYEKKSAGKTDSRVKDMPERSVSGNSKIDAKILEHKNMFDFGKMPEDAVKVLENFDEIVQSVRPLNSRQMQGLSKDIRALSHQLTDERSSRRLGYMNANQELSAYIRYFTWWNLVRLTRVFSNIPADSFSLNDGDVILDIGSGPLTVVSALWLSRPELRNKKLTVYAMDISQGTMAAGEDLYLSIAAKAFPSDENAMPHWNIIRVKGEIGTSIRKKANLITCANMFNELYNKEHEKPEKIADAQIQNLLLYADERCSFFIAEPGMPVAGRFISLMRERFIKSGYYIVAPCPHQGVCSMDGNHARYGGSAKWCNFSFSTENAPKKLLKLSEAAGIPKERAVISFIFAGEKKPAAKTEENPEILSVDVVSDPIFLPPRSAGFYCCSQKGMVLVVNAGGKRLKSGDKLKMSMQKSTDILEKDKKTGALLIKA